MTHRSFLRLRSLASPRRRPQFAIDSNADVTIARSTGDPRLDLARAIPRAASLR